MLGKRLQTQCSTIQFPIRIGSSYAFGLRDMAQYVSKLEQMNIGLQGIFEHAEACCRLPNSQVRHSTSGYLLSRQ